MSRAAATDLVHALRPYGMVGHWADEPSWSSHARLSPDPMDFADLPVECQAATGPILYHQHRRGPLGWPIRRPACRALLPHVTFRGPDLVPLWTDAAGRAVAAWRRPAGRDDQPMLLLGLDVAGEIIRHRQGDPARAQAGAAASPARAKFGFDFERPNYLFDHQLDPHRPTMPWADALGFAVARWISELTGRPLVEPLPGGARGLVLLTGDDDQALLERYDDQLRLIDGTPMTYFLLPHTRHTSATLAAIPASVEFGVHVDALEAPADYDQVCATQTSQVRALTGRPCRSVRNHGFLNRGYLGHLAAWEHNGLRLDLNLPGVDGTALNGSFLPARVRRPGGDWSSHFTLLTAFGDGMLYALGMSPRAAARRVRSLGRQIEATWPGVVVFNLHPQNIARTAALHHAAIALARRPGWTAMTVEQYLDWIERVDQLELRRQSGQWVLSTQSRSDSAEPEHSALGTSRSALVEDLVMRVPAGSGWRRIALASWTGQQEIDVA